MAKEAESKTKVTNETRRADAEKRRAENRKEQGFKETEKRKEVNSTTVAPQDSDELEPKTEDRMPEDAVVEDEKPAEGEESAEADESKEETPKDSEKADKKK